MAETKKTRPPKKRGKQGYVARERAICIVVHDPGGKPIAPEVVEDILNTVNEKSLANGLLLSFTQT